MSKTQAPFTNIGVAESALHSTPRGPGVYAYYVTMQQCLQKFWFAQLTNYENF